jgi:predicted Zn-dependent protease
VKIARWKLAAFTVGVFSLLALALPSQGDLGWGYLSLRDYARARASFVRQLRVDPGDADAWLGLAGVFEAMGDSDRQIRTLEAIARHFPRERAAQVHLADVYVWNRDLESAARTLEQLATRSDDGSPLQRLLNLYVWLGRYDDVGRTLDRLLAQRSAALSAVDDVVIAGWLLGRPADVMPPAEAYAERRPNDVEVQRRLAESYDLLEWRDRAVQRWRVVVRLLPNDVRALEALRRADPADEATRRRLVDVYFSEGDVARALPVQRELVALAPRDPVRLLTLGRLLVEQDRASEAVAFYEQVVALAPEDRQTLATLLQLYGQTNQPGRALDILEREVAAKPGDRELEERIVVMALAAGDGRRAVAALDRLSGQFPGETKYVERAVDALVGANRAAEVIPRQRRLVERAPLERAPALRLAQLYEWTNQPGESLTILDRLASAHPDDRGLNERVVVLARAAGDVGRAVATLDRLAGRFLGETKYTEQAVDALVGADRAAEAIPRQRRLVERAPLERAPALRLAQLCEWTNQPGEALTILDRVATAHPDDRGLGERVVLLARAAGDTPRAVAVLDRLAGKFPDEARRYLAQTVELLLAADRAADAVPRQRRLVELNPGAPAPALRLAQLHDALGQEREAIGVYEGLDRGGGLAETSLRRLGDLYRFQNRPADFLRVAERLLAHRPTDDALRAAAVETATGLGRTEQAVQFLRTAPGGSSPSARMRIARLLTDLGRHADAIAEYEAILAQMPARFEAPGRLAIHTALAQLYDWTGAGARALAQWEALLRVHPRDPAALREVGRRSLALSRTDAALRAYRALLVERPADPEALKRIGQMLAWTNDPVGARASLEQFNRVKGGDYEVQFLLGELYTAARDEARARDAYEKALRLMPPRAARE